jgi:lauroyl/myristoyl acyltransferase
MRRLRRQAVALPLPFLARILTRIPYRILRPFAIVFIAWPAWLTHRSKATKHLNTAFGSNMSRTRRRQITRRVAANIADLVTENLHIQRLGAGVFDNHMDDEEAGETLRRMEAASQSGLLGVTALESHLRKVRQRTGLETIYEDEPAKRVLRCLRNRQIVGTAPDRDMKNGAGIFVDFFGRPAFTSIGPARLSLASGAPIFTSFCLRSPAGFRILMNEPHYPDPDRPRREEIVRLTRAWAGEVEDVIRAFPEQWAWFHDRWRTRPEKLEAQNRRVRSSSVDGLSA